LPVQRTIGVQNAHTEVSDNATQSCAADGNGVARELIGVDHRQSTLAEHATDGAFSGADAPRQTDDKEIHCHAIAVAHHRRRCYAPRMKVPGWMLVTAIAACVVALLSFTRVAAASGGVDHDFIGADRCKSCHAEAFAAWEQSPHARAMDVLSSTEQKDPRCLSCHTTVAADLAPSLRGVQCESCHGPGRHYAPDYIMRDAELSKALFLQKGDEQTCKRCHTDSSPSLLPFRYEEKRLLIKHWKD
jgi:hypothetical protein